MRVKRHVHSVSFDNMNSIATIDHPEFGELSLYISDYHDESDGIGSYECHGYVGFDAGKTYRVVDDIELVDDSSMTKNQFEAASNWVKKMWNDGLIEAEVASFEDDLYEHDDYDEDADL